MTETALIVSNAALWVILLFMGAVVFALMRQIGVLHDRLAPAGALSLSGGIAVDQAVPATELRNLTGDPVTLGEGTETDKATLIVFTAPNCPVCAELIETVKPLARQEAGWLRVILASDGPDDDHRRYIAEKRLEEIPYVVSRDLGLAFEVGKLPYAALVDSKGVLRAKGLANSREHLESLFNALEMGVGSIQDYLRQKRGAA